MIVRVHDLYFGIDELILSLADAVKLKMFGKVYVFHAKKEGGNIKLPFYIVKCRKCDAYFLDHPHEPDGYFLCPLCERKGDLSIEKEA